MSASASDRIRIPGTAVVWIDANSNVRRGVVVRPSEYDSAIVVSCDGWESVINHERIGVE